MVPEACRSINLSLGTFPFVERLRTWMLPVEERLLRAETRVLEGIHSNVKVLDVPVKDGTVHTLHVHSGTGLAPVVLIHGYFMGSASWAHSFDSLSSSRDLYAIDWPSWGLSSPQAFPQSQSVEDCEEFFVNGTESWRQSVGLERMVLLGHSFGGYFAACYTMKYPERVESLILASPVGMLPQRPEAITYEERVKSMPWWQRFLFFRVRNMWEAGWTPMDVVRLMGPFGTRLTEPRASASCLFETYIVIFLNIVILHIRV